jgi:hypothetical protein
MDKELVEMVFEFTFAMTTLFLVLESFVPGWIGVPTAGFVLSVDLARAFEAWARARRKLDNKDNQA